MNDEEKTKEQIMDELKAMHKRISDLEILETQHKQTEQAWLEVDLGKPMTLNRVKIAEEYDRVREFELQYRDGRQWKTFARGTKLGHDYSQQFEPVTARYVRLNILKAIEGPTIWEFQLFAPKKQ